MLLLLFFPQPPSTAEKLRDATRSSPFLQLTQARTLGADSQTRRRRHPASAVECDVTRNQRAVVLGTVASSDLPRKLQQNEKTARPPEGTGNQRTGKGNSTRFHCIHGVCFLENGPSLGEPCRLDLVLMPPAKVAGE